MWYFYLSNVLGNRTAIPECDDTEDAEDVEDVSSNMNICTVAIMDHRFTSMLPYTMYFDLIKESQR